jgi:hypothetical protein
MYYLVNLHHRDEVVVLRILINTQIEENDQDPNTFSTLFELKFKNMVRRCRKSTSFQT